MPKMKTNKGTKKRFRITATGKIIRKKACTRHLLSAKSPSRKRRLRKAAVVEKANSRSIKRLLPYA
ncbi:MAG TPA: 50S ribosomal protein L35 [Thermodesulfobacteriota bacterium]|nr:50S ribosomal protein L35 [Thermodesulfobacteriota bacterium]